MKITVWDRIWSALSGVLIVLAGLWLLGLVFVVQPTWLEACIISYSGCCSHSCER